VRELFAPAIPLVETDRNERHTIANATTAHRGLFLREAIVIISLMAKLSRLFASPFSTRQKP
jgi:hypothetical protein